MGVNAGEKKCSSTILFHHRGRMKVLILIIVQFFTAGLFLLLGYLILKRQAYGLVSGFNMKTEEEQEQLIANGYPQANARGVIRSGWILAAGAVLHISGVPFAAEISWLVMFIYLFSYLFFINKLSLERERKRNAVILTIVVVFTGGLLTAVFYAGLSDNELYTTETEVVIDGLYGVEWEFEEVTSVNLISEMPEIRARTNGFSFSGRAKGQFRLEELGHGRLFLTNVEQPPFLHIATEDDYAIINWENPEKTEMNYEKLQRRVE